jgi:glutamate racemase
MSDQRPIGVFDSGVGGLTVLRALHELVPNESTIYLGDLARCPYGPREQWQVSEFAVQIADLLAGHDIKLLVVACNTATAAAYERLRDRYSFPVIGVVAPGALAAAKTTQNRRVGIIATLGTVASNAYGEAVHAALPDAVVIQEAASWLVPMIEQGAIARTRVARELLPSMDRFRNAAIDTLILGCTHFPLVREIFEDEAGPGIEVIDSAVTTAIEVERTLRELGLEHRGVAEHRFLVTGPAEAFSERAQAMFRSSPPIETVDLVSGAA